MTPENSDKNSDEIYLDLDEEQDAARTIQEAVEAVEAVARQADDEGPGADGGAALGDRVIELENEVKEQRERALRALADYENFSRRAIRERSELLRYAAEEPLREVLPVVDNLERALRAEGTLEDIREGVEMIHRQLVDVLGRLSAATVPTLGTRFDPSVHEAVATVVDPNVEVATVIDELQKGYFLHDRLLRPAMVRVAVPPADKRPAAERASSSEPNEATRDEVGVAVPGEG